MSARGFVLILARQQNVAQVAFAEYYDVRSRSVTIAQCWGSELPVRRFRNPVSSVGHLHLPHTPVNIEVDAGDERAGV
jgi:hypothetical protein